jgi:hypothetical protein
MLRVEMAGVVGANVTKLSHAVCHTLKNPEGP